MDFQDLVHQLGALNGDHGQEGLMLGRWGLGQTLYATTVGEWDTWERAVPIRREDEKGREPAQA
eukprot:3663963-Karenia_brevis.AAC.1